MYIKSFTFSSSDFERFSEIFVRDHNILAIVALVLNCWWNQHIIGTQTVNVYCNFGFHSKEIQREFDLAGTNVDQSRTGLRVILHWERTTLTLL